MKRLSKNLVGFRQYLHSPHSYQDLEYILKTVLEESNPLLRDFDFMLAICGDAPEKIVKQLGVSDRVAIYDYAKLRLSPSQLVKRLVYDIQDESAIKIIYYSDFPEGLTYPVDLFTQITTFLNYRHLAVCDSDFQILYEEIFRAYDFHLQNSDARLPSITFPRRLRRSLEVENYPINRWAMEDIENLYVYFLSNIKYLDLKLDIQSGLFFTNHLANIALDFSRVGKWVGNLHLAISLLRLPDVAVHQVKVKTNVQHDSSISFDVQCTKIDELYDYYLIPMENIIRIALDNPRKYLMPDWSRALSLAEIEGILQNIYEAYVHHKNRVV